MTDCHCYWNISPTTSLYSHPLFGLQKHSANISECQQVQSFHHGGIQWHTFDLNALLCQIPFCQTAPLLPSVTWQQNGGWEGSASTATPSTFASDFVGKHHKVGSNALKAALIKIHSKYLSNLHFPLPHHQYLNFRTLLLLISYDFLFCSTPWYCAFIPRSEQPKFFCKNFLASS